MKLGTSNPYLNHNSYHVFFINLANQLKIGIILSLRKKEKSVTELSNHLNVEQSKISHALTSLKNCKIVEYKRRGKEKIYHLNKKTILPILNVIDKHASVYCKGGCCVDKKCGGMR